MDYKGPRCKNRKVILTLVWLLELQADIRSLHSYELAKYRPAEQGTLQTTNQVVVILARSQL